MKRLQKITHLEELEQFQLSPGLPALDANDLTGHIPDAHWVLTEGASLLARCSLWWQSTPAYAGRRTGIIGHFAAHDEDSAPLLLEHACGLLREQGCEYAVGPMDGNTWRRYRLVTEPGDEPSFFLEPHNPSDWPAHWQAANFTSIAEYSSRLNTDLSYVDPRLGRVERRLHRQNIRIHTLNLDDYEAELRRIFELSCISFRPNFLYTPLQEREFVQMYSRLRPHIRPELVLLAMQGSQLAGFLFAVPDWLQVRRNRDIDTAIIKTLAVLPGRAYAGLGNLLAAHCHRAARDLGYTRAIHALMHDANHSRNVSSRYAHVMRRYALYGRSL